MRSYILIMLLIALTLIMPVNSLLCDETQTKPSKDSADKSNEVKSEEEELQEISEMLESSDDEARIKAMDMLINMRTRDTIPLAIKALKDKNDQVRYKAICAIYNYRDDSAIPAILEALHDPYHQVRYLAAELVGKMKLKEAIPALIDLFMDENSDVVRSSCYALSKIGKLAVPKLIESLKHENVRIRCSSCFVLGQIKDESAVPALLIAVHEKRVHKTDPSVQQSAIYALGMIGSDSAVPTIVKFIDDEDYNVRSKAIDALGRIGSERAVNALISRYNRVDDSNCLVALGDTGSKTATPLLITVLLNHRDSTNRCEACFALGKIKDRSSIDALKSAIYDQSTGVRSAVISVLVNMNADGLETTLRDAFLKETDQYNKYQFAQYIVIYEAYSGIEKRIVDALVSNLPKSRFSASFEHRNFLIPFDDLAIDALIKILNTYEDSTIKHNTIGLLSDFTGEKVVNTLCKELSNDEVVYSAISALGKVGDDRAMPAIEKYFNSEKFFFSVKFIDAIFQIGGNKAISILEKLFTKLDDEKIKIQIASYLVRLKSDKSSEMYEFLLNSIHSKIKGVATEAYRQLGEIGDNKAIPYIIEAIKNDPIEVSGNSLFALDRIGDKSVLPILVKLFEDEKYAKFRKALPFYSICIGVIDKQLYIDMLTDDYYRYNRSWILSALGSYDNVDLSFYYEGKIESEDTSDIIGAISYYRYTGDRTYIDKIKPFVNHKDDKLRQEAICAIGKLGGPKSELVLVNGLNDKVEKTRHYSALLIMRNKQKSAKEALQKRFEVENDDMTKISIAAALVAIGADEDGKMLQYACSSKYRGYYSLETNYWLFVEMGFKEAIPYMIKDLGNYDSSIKSGAANALAELNAKSAIPALKKAYDNSLTYIQRLNKYTLAIALVKLGDKDSWNLLLNSLNSRNNGERELAVKTLGEYADESIIPHLEKVIENDYCYKVREAAKAAINNIKNKTKKDD